MEYIKPPRDETFPEDYGHLTTLRNVTEDAHLQKENKSKLRFREEEWLGSHEESVSRTRFSDIASLAQSSAGEVAQTNYTVEPQRLFYHLIYGYLICSVYLALYNK